MVAPWPQAKGKIERRFGAFQRRLVTLLAHANARSFDEANRILQMEIDRPNATVHFPINEVPAEIFARSGKDNSSALRPPPAATLLDLHFSLRASRKVHNDSAIDFDGKSYHIAPTSKKYVTVLFHPHSQLWVLEDKPDRIWPTILGHFCL